MSPQSQDPIIFLDTTLRDGELMAGVSMTVLDKIEIAVLLETMGVDAIEVGYPGQIEQDFEAVQEIAAQLKTATVCALAGAAEAEIVKAAAALAPAQNARIHTYASVNLKTQAKRDRKSVLATIQESVALARTYCDDVEWTAFDATRSDPDFLCLAMENAIAAGATTINIADSLGLASTEEFSQLMHLIFGRVSCGGETSSRENRTIISVHCHDDLGLAAANSIAALHCGVRQLECSINGLGARKGNADLASIVERLAQSPQYQIRLNTSLLPQLSQRVAQTTATR